MDDTKTGAAVAF